MPEAMRIAVVVEQGWDPFSIEVDPVTGDVDWARAAPAPAPGSLEAVETGLRLGDVVVFGVGAGPVDALLRECLALGAAPAVRAPDVPALAAAIGAEAFDLVLAPHRSTDHGSGLLAPLLAGLLDLPQATAVESLAVAGGEAVVTRRLDRGEREELALALPAVVALEPGICRPRTATPAALIAAASAVVEELPGLAGPAARFRGHLPPRPAPPRMAWPDAGLSAEARIAAVIGTADIGHGRELVTGPAEKIADRIVRFLEARGFVGATLASPAGPSGPGPDGG
jgi:electron transfer flavoprotein beta subunit